MVDQAPPRDVYREQFEKLGAELVDKANQPNIITLAQFKPFIEVFKVDQDRFKAEKPDGPYYRHIVRLTFQYWRTLGINLYQPTIVIASEQDRTEVAFLDRVFTRIQPDIAKPGQSAKRDTIGGVSKLSVESHSQLLLEASMVDLYDANATPEQQDYFARVRAGSSLIQKLFTENNLSLDKRKEAMEGVTEVAGEETESETVFGMVDDGD